MTIVWKEYSDSQGNIWLEPEYVVPDNQKVENDERRIFLEQQTIEANDALGSAK